MFTSALGVLLVALLVGSVLVLVGTDVSSARGPSSAQAPGTSASLAAGPPPTFRVVFTETGLRAATNWSVTLNGVTENSSAPTTISFSEPKGVYPFSVTAVQGYTETPRSGTITISSSTVTQPITFLEVASTTSSGLPSLTGANGYYLLGVVCVAVAVLVGLDLVLRRRGRQRPVES